jgi:hypothetical protein
MPSPLRALSLISCLAAPLAAQAVEGVASAGGAPVGYALVFLVDSTGHEVGATLSDADGRFALRATAPGSHRVAVRRVGQRIWLSEPVILGSGVQPLSLDLPDQPVRLPDLRPEATGRCRVRPALGVATTALLDAARTGLGVAEATTRLGAIHARVETRLRFLDPALEVKSEEHATATDRLVWPFATLPPESVAVAGFVGPVQDGARDYFGPDARLLGADWFLDEYCFDLVLPESPGDTLVGVAFQPERSSPRADLRGTLWLDRRTLGFHRLEFRWTGLGAWVPSEAAGGDLGFVPIPGGGLLLGRWWVRVPLADYFGRDPVLVGFLEAAGEVMEVLGAPPAP